MTQKICLRCGGFSAGYATQCSCCGHFLAAVYASDKRVNQHIRQVLTLHREGKSCAEIAGHINTSQSPQTTGAQVWDSYAVAILIHQFTSDRVGISEADGIDCCPSCQIPVPAAGTVCAACRETADKNAAIRRQLESPGSMGKSVLIFNAVMIVVLVVYVFVCIHIIQEKTRHEAAFGEFFLSIFGFIVGVGIWLVGNLSFGAAAIFGKILGRKD